MNGLHHRRTSSTFGGRQLGPQLVPLSLQLLVLLLQCADGGGQRRHVRVLRLFLRL